MKEPVSVSVSVSIRTDKDSRKSLDVSEQGRNVKSCCLCLSLLDIPFRHSRNRAILRVFCVGRKIILPMPEKRIQRHCRAVTSDSENLLRYRDRNIKASCHNQTDTQQEPMKEPVSVSVSIQTDKDTRKSMDHVSEQGRNVKPLCLSCLGVPFRHSRNRAILGRFDVRGIIILPTRFKGIQRHCTACMNVLNVNTRQFTKSLPIFTNSLLKLKISMIKFKIYFNLF